MANKREEMDYFPHIIESYHKGYGVLNYIGYGNDKLGEMCVNNWYSEIRFCKANDDGNKVGRNYKTSMFIQKCFM